MNAVIKNIALKYFILLLVVQTINLSINSIDFYNTYKVETETDNSDYVDSMLEFVLENVIGYSKDTMRDKANPDGTAKQQQIPVYIELKWFPLHTLISRTNESISEILIHIPRSEEFQNLYFKEVPSKPPQFSMA
jgi:hypothetical protein